MKACVKARNKRNVFDRHAKPRQFKQLYRKVFPWLFVQKDKYTITSRSHGHIHAVRSEVKSTVYVAPSLELLIFKLCRVFFFARGRGEPQVTYTFFEGGFDKSLSNGP